jgi:hypothetical protein
MPAGIDQKLEELRAAAVHYALMRRQIRVTQADVQRWTFGRSLPDAMSLALEQSQVRVRPEALPELVPVVRWSRRLIFVLAALIPVLSVIAVAFERDRLVGFVARLLP